VVEPSTKLVWNWHIDAICTHLEAVSRGEIRRLIINIPPGHMKSLLVSVFWPAWNWLQRPDWRALFCSSGLDLVIRDTRRCRDIITSEWFLETFEPEWSLRLDQNAKQYFELDSTGQRKTASVGSKVTGFRGDTVVIDDPLDATDAHSKAKRKACLTWFKETISSRVNDPRSGVFVLIMQRLHEEDLSGYLLDSHDGWCHLCLPTEYEPKRSQPTSIGWEDPREKKGDLLFPEFFTDDVLDELKTILGSRGYAGQHQQRPSAEKGDIFEREWWQRYQELPNRWDALIQSWDCTFKGTSDSDFVVGQVWGVRGSNFYLLDQIRAQLTFPATLKAIRSLSKKWPECNAILVEDKANGPAVIQTLKGEIPGLIAVNPQGGKEVRANAVSPLVEAGNVWLPEYASWAGDYIEEHTVFPNGANDDQVDATTQALLRLRPFAKSRTKKSRALSQDDLKRIPS
jgi:predicted phage terminase large subunit-like protein